MTNKKTTLGKICLLLAFVMMATALPAQKRTTTRRKKATAVVAKQKPEPAIIPVDSLIGRVYAGKVGQTVVDFFGTRTTYGDVIQQIFFWHDSIAVLNQRGGDMETYRVLPYKLVNSTLTVGEFTYTTINGGSALELQKTKEENEIRQGTISQINPSMMVNALYIRGKHLDGMTIQTDEDKADARTCLSIAAEYGGAEARKYLYDYYKKRADNGEEDALKYMLDYEAVAENYSTAHKYCDKLIEMHPDNMELLCEKGMLYLAESKLSDAKKLLKKIKKLDAGFPETSSHPFIEHMKTVL